MIMAAAMAPVEVGHRRYFGTENDLAVTAAEMQAGTCTFPVAKPSRPAVMVQSTAAFDLAHSCDRHHVIAASAPPPAAEPPAALRRLFLDK